MDRTFAPARVPPPGRILSRELEARGWTQKELAKIIGRPEQAISEIVNAKKQITPETARELAAAFGTSAALWVNLEASYQLHQVQKKEVDRDIGRRARLRELAPVADLQKRGWIKDTNDLDELEREICTFFNINSPNETPTLLAHLRHSAHRGPETSLLSAWAMRLENRVRQEASLPRFRKKEILAALPELLECAATVERIKGVPGWLRSNGVHFLLEKHLPKTYVDGAAFFVDRHPVVALTLRYDRIDNFWFTLLHELAHLLLGHQGVYVDRLEGSSDDAKNDETEREANAQAKAWLFPEGAFEAFLQDECFSKACIESFAEGQRRHPGIVVGRLQWEGSISYRAHRSLLEPVSPHLAVA